MIRRAFALLVAGPFRFLVIAAAAFTCLAAYLYLPVISRNEGTPLAVAPSGSRAVTTEQRAAADFGFPFFSDIVIVQRAPHGLGVDATQRVVDRATQVDQGRVKASYPRILGAIPLVNEKPLVPGSKESGTTAVTLLQVDPSMSLYAQYQLAQRYVQEQVNRPEDHVVGITGAIPARALQGDLIDQSLPMVELASVALIFLLITVRFRAPGAGVLTLGASGVAYFLSGRVVAWAAARYGLDIPVELQPLLVVLVLAVVTDYSVFLLAGARSELAEGERPSAAARMATTRFAPIILVAALTVAGSAASLALADLEFLRVLGPALAVSVMVSAVVALTIVPAALASFGRWILWPGFGRTSRSTDATATPADPGPLRRALAGLQSIRLVAFGLVGLTALVLLAASTGLSHLRTGISILDDIPSSSAESRAAQAASEGFAAGIISPSDLVVEQPGIGSRRVELARLESEVGAEPGVAAVFGPREQIPGMPQDVFIAGSGNAARIVIVLADDPYGASAIAAVRRIGADLPRLMAAAGLRGARAGIAGDTEAGAETISALESSMLPAAIAIVAIEFALMALLLRALVAPLYLLAAGALSATAPLGLMAYLMTRLGHADVSYYVPIGVAVLMVSLGADYNLFLVGRIWEELNQRSVGEAVRVAAPRAGASIATAALALSVSFASLALVPLTSFRAFAFAMAAGALIDSYLVRGQLVPAMVTLFGRAGAWPGSASSAVARRFEVA